MNHISNIMAIAIFAWPGRMKELHANEMTRKSGKHFSRVNKYHVCYLLELISNWISDRWTVKWFLCLHFLGIVEHAVCPTWIRYKVEAQPNAKAYTSRSNKCLIQVIEQNVELTPFEYHPIHNPIIRVSLSLTLVWNYILLFDAPSKQHPFVQILYDFWPSSFSSPSFYFLYLFTHFRLSLCFTWARK